MSKVVDARARRPAVTRRRERGPISVVLPVELRNTVSREARYRGLKLSTTIRVLVGERLREIEEASELTEADRWQRAQAWATWEKIEAGDRREVAPAEVDEVFRRALKRAQRRSR